VNACDHHLLNMHSPCRFGSTSTHVTH
jgi:hypothetical protein